MLFSISDEPIESEDARWNKVVWFEEIEVLNLVGKRSASA